MTEYLNSLTTWQFALFLVVVFLASMQTMLLARHVVRGSSASLIPGILAIVGAVILFATR